MQNQDMGICKFWCINKKFWEELIAYIPCTIIWVCDKSRMKTSVGTRNKVNKLIQFEWLECWHYWWELFRKYTVDTASDGVIYIQSFIMIGSGIQVILRLILQQFERLQCWHYWWERFTKCSIDMTSGGMTYMRSFKSIGFGHSSNIKVVASTVWEAVVSVFLKRKFCDIWPLDCLRWHDIYTKSVQTFKQYQGWRIPSSGMWRRVGILLIDVSEERIASIFRVQEIHERWTSVSR
jgi:hypothetical protein